MGFVYIIKSNHYHKIGRTIFIEQRLSDIQVSNPYDIELIHSIETSDDKGAEKLLHRIFRHKRVRGEWFNLSTRDVNFVKTIAGYIDGSFTWHSVPVINVDKEEPLRSNKMYPVYHRDQELMITERQILSFIQTAWRRQEEGKRALSYSYWCTNRRMKTYIYYGILDILVKAGIVINRRKGAEGELAYPPVDAAIMLQLI